MRRIARCTRRGQQHDEEQPQGQDAPRMGEAGEDRGTEQPVAEGVPAADRTDDGRTCQRQ